MPPKNQQFQITITDDDHLQKYINSENKKLVIIDWYPNWSGPCSLMQTTYKDLAMSVEDFDKRVDILCVEQEKVPQLKHERLPRDMSSKPRFVFFQGGKVIDEVVGADSPQLEEKVIKNLPMVY